MAKYENLFYGDFDDVLNLCDNIIMEKSASASYEDGSDWKNADVRVAVRVYERYSYFGGNRVSMNLTLVGTGNQLFLTVITSGGSQALFHKINTMGEETFLETLIPDIEDYIGRHR